MCSVCLSVNERATLLWLLLLLSLLRAVWLAWEGASRWCASLLVGWVRIVEGGGTGSKLSIVLEFALAIVV